MSSGTIQQEHRTPIRLEAKLVVPGGGGLRAAPDGLHHGVSGWEAAFPVATRYQRAESVKRPDTGQLDTAGNQAPDGIVGPYREREGSFYAIQDIWSPIPWSPKTNALVEIKVPPVKSRFRAKASVKERAKEIEMLGGQLQVRIDRQTGLLTRVQRGRQTFPFPNGPRLTAGQATLTELKTEKLPDKSAASVTANFTGALQKIVWHLRNDGWLQCNYSYTAKGTNDYFGVLFDFPENLVTGKRWLGDGPYRVWKNRLRGMTPGVWANAYNNTITGYRGWIYPEFKGCFANVRWLQLETTEGLITVVPENIPYVQVLTPAQAPTNLVANTKINLPPCGLGFLHAIPPIGTKFKPANQGGPQGQPNIGAGEYSGSVSFYFGKLP